MELFVQFSGLLINFSHLLGAVSSQVRSYLSVDLVEVLIDIGVALLELLLGELGDFALHHGLLISEEAVRTAEEAF